MLHAVTRLHIRTASLASSKFFVFVVTRIHRPLTLYRACHFALPLRRESTIAPSDRATECSNNFGITICPNDGYSNSIQSQIDLRNKCATRFQRRVERAETARRSQREFWPYRQFAGGNIVEQLQLTNDASKGPGELHHSDQQGTSATIDPRQGCGQN